MVWLKAAKEVGKAALKTKAGKKATMEVGKHLKTLQEGMKDARKTFKASLAKSKEEERKAYRNIGLTISGLLGAAKWKQSSVNKIRAASNAATKADAIAKIQKATKNNTAAQRFKNRVKK